MKSYQELLSTTDWRSKRYSIISRDKNQCIHCDNSTYLKENKSGDIINGVLSYQIGDYINKSKFVKNWCKVSVVESNTTYIYHNGTTKPVHEATFSSYDYFAPERLKGLHVV